LTPTIQSGTGKPGEVIRGSGDGSPPAGSRGRAPKTGIWGAELPEAEQVLKIIKTFGLKFL